jgi:hypothetical protein
VNFAGKTSMGAGSHASVWTKKEARMKLERRGMLSAAFGLLIGAAVATGGAGVMAQDATPVGGNEATPAAGTQAKPIHIHAGSCPDVGEVVAPLNDLAIAAGNMSDADTSMGDMARGIPVEYSFTTVELPLDAIMGGEHAINVHESAENISNYIACGDLAGTVDANGSLAIGLQELNGSGYAGVALLSPNAEDAGSTDVWVFLARDLHEDDGM